MAVHPRDHVFAYAYQGASTQTDVTLATLKVRVNGGSATTYTNVSSPAVTQNADCNFGYRVEIPANTYADGDKVERTWLYNSVAQAYGEDVISFAAVDGAHYTAARGDKLDNADAAVSAVKAKTDLIPAAGPADAAHFTNARGDLLANLDAAISSRSTVAAIWAAVADSAGVTTLLSRLTSGRATLLDNLDAAVSTRSTYAGGDTSGTTTLLSRLTSTRAGYLDNLTNLDAAISALPAAVWNALTSALTTVGSVGKLLATNIDAAVSSRSTYAGSDTSGTTTLLSRLTGTRATNLDHLDADVSTRLATSGYTAPDNADISAIKAKTDNLPADPASQATVLAAISAIDVSAVAATVWTYVRRTLTHSPRAEG